MIGKWAHRMNDFCLGWNYKKRLNRLKIIGAYEQGSWRGLDHIHLVFGHDQECLRSYAEISTESKKRWHQLTESQESMFGTQVNVRPVQDLRGCLGYVFKDTLSRIRQGDFNVAMF